VALPALQKAPADEHLGLEPGHTMLCLDLPVPSGALVLYGHLCVARNQRKTKRKPVISLAGLVQARLDIFDQFE